MTFYLPYFFGGHPVVDWENGSLVQGKLKVSEEIQAKKYRWMDLSDKFLCYIIYCQPCQFHRDSWYSFNDQKSYGDTVIKVLESNF